jgi:hypothetical protein
LMSVSASEGTIRPSDVVKMMCVPECGGVPDCSTTWAITCAVPLTGSAVVEAVSVIVDPLGASSGTRSHATRTMLANAAHTTARRERAIFKILSILVP